MPQFYKKHFAHIVLANTSKCNTGELLVASSCISSNLLSNNNGEIFTKICVINSLKNVECRCNPGYFEPLCVCYGNLADYVKIKPYKTSAIVTFNVSYDLFK